MAPSATSPRPSGQFPTTTTSTSPPPPPTSTDLKSSLSSFSFFSPRRSSNLRQSNAEVETHTRPLLPPIDAPSTSPSSQNAALPSPPLVRSSRASSFSKSVKPRLSNQGRSYQSFHIRESAPLASSTPPSAQLTNPTESAQSNNYNPRGKAPQLPPSGAQSVKTPPLQDRPHATATATTTIAEMPSENDSTSPQNALDIQVNADNRSDASSGMQIASSWTADEGEIREGTAQLGDLELISGSVPEIKYSSSVKSRSPRPNNELPPSSSFVPPPSTSSTTIASSASPQGMSNLSRALLGYRHSPEQESSSLLRPQLQTSSEENDEDGDATPVAHSPDLQPSASSSTVSTTATTDAPVQQTKSHNRTDDDAPASERTPLLSGLSAGGAIPNGHTESWGFKVDKEPVFQRATRKFRDVDWTETLVKEPLRALPAVVLGLLLNCLDGVSYGLVTFNTSMATFSNFGGIGVSMFFVSCIISQLVYSLGGSVFKAGNGSMLIEVVPFFHSFTVKIVRTIGEDNPQSIIATTMVAIALSSILTGLAFYLLGVLKLGRFIQFFPRHILVGTIGGVGAFLVITGFQVSSRLEDEDLSFTFGSLEQFFTKDVLPLWATPLALAIALRAITAWFDHPLLFPSYFVAIPIVFYIAIAAARIPLDTLRQTGWVFAMNGVDSKWWEYITYYNFSLVNFQAIVATIPTQLALVFFALLHVPINVPALGLSVGEDDVDLDRELRAHGYSNVLAGVFGTVANYLCYVNSVLFYRVGGTTRTSGVLLAIATALVLFAGPAVISFLPVLVVGALIFVLGFDLLKEAVWDTWGRVSAFEYVTIIAIVVVMTFYDFVVGIGVGIVLACVSFVFVSAQRQAVKAILSGENVRSTVRRHPRQAAFLRLVGSQTKIIKLSGHLFFGTIGAVEKTMRGVLETSAWNSNPVRFLILDFSRVNGVDFSAAEAFLRITRLLWDREVILVLCGVEPNSTVGKALRSVGLWAGEHVEVSNVEVFATLNDALERCENSYLKTLYSRELVHHQAGASDFPSFGLDIPKLAAQPEEPLSMSPRWSHIQDAAQTTLASAHVDPPPSTTNYTQPFPLLTQALRPYSEELSLNFFHRLAPYFSRVELPQGKVLFRVEDPADSFYFIEAGIIRATYYFSGAMLGPSGNTSILESCMPGTSLGEMTFLAGSKRNATLQAERASILWRLDRIAWERMGREWPEGRDQVSKLLLHGAEGEQEVLMGHLISTL